METGMVLPSNEVPNPKPTLPYTPRPLQPNSFTGMADTSSAAVETRFKHSTNHNVNSNSELYNNRLQANLELNENPDYGLNAWNRRRKEAIERGEDPNSEMLEMMERRVPDSYLERLWRKVRGKGRTRRDERDERERREKREMEKGEGEIDVGFGQKWEDDGVIR